MFKPNFNFGKLGLLGLDIGSHCLKIVKLARAGGGRFKIDFCGAYDVEENSVTFQETVHDILKTNNLLGLPTAACINDPSLKIRKVELPPMPESDLKDALRWKMRDAVEGAIEDYTVAHSILEESIMAGAKKQILVGYAIKRQSIFEWMGRLTKLGLKPKILEPAVISLASCIEKIYPSEDNWIAGIDLGAYKCMLVIVGRGKFYFSRPLSGIQLSEARSDLNGFMQKLAAEIQNSIDTFSVIFQVEKINRILLSGGGAVLPGLSEYLTKNLGVETGILNPFAIAEPSENQKIPPDQQHLYAQAAALAWTDL